MSVSYFVEVDPRDFLGAFGRLRVDGLRMMNRAVAEAIKAAEARAKGTTLYRDRTGELRRKTLGEFTPSDGESDAVGFVRADTKYAAYVERGRGPVVAKGRALRFVVDGKVIFRKRVRAAAPRPFMAQAREVGERALADGAEDYWQAAVDGFERDGEMWSAWDY